jgi:hypothetical protein
MDLLGGDAWEPHLAEIGAINLEIQLQDRLRTSRSDCCKRTSMRPLTTHEIRAM